MFDLSRNLDFKCSYIVSSLSAAVIFALSGVSMAAPAYSINKVLVADDQYQGEAGLIPAPIYKPHEVVVSRRPNIWISSSEREGQAGITVFGPGKRVLKVVNIVEPGLEFPRRMIHRPSSISTVRRS